MVCAMISSDICLLDFPLTFKVRPFQLFGIITGDFAIDMFMYLYPHKLAKSARSLLGVFWKCARVGERASPYVSIALIYMAINQIRS
ncbi:unnamed protein product [Wickerhamomyces anomalus]